MNRFKQQDGIILVGALITMVFFMTVSLAIAEFASTHYQNTRRTLVALEALSVAEAGADNYMYNLNANPIYTPPTGQQTYTPNSGVPTPGKLTYETFVTTSLATDPNCNYPALLSEKILCVTGRVFLPSTASSPLVTRKIKLTLIGSNPNAYSVQTGAGGLTMSNSAGIPSGNVAVNGTITMKNSASIGTISLPNQVSAAGYSCPTGANPGPTYPSLCPLTSPTFKSVTLQNSAKICGVVHINLFHSADAPNCSPVGVVIQDSPTPVPLPADNRAAVKLTTITPGTAAAESCDSTQTRTWSNIHITGGDVTVDGHCVVTIGGNVWIDGGLIVKNQGSIQAAAGVGAVPIFLIDGPTGVQLKNQATVATNATGTGMEFITYYCQLASGLPCLPDTLDLTGNDLAISQTLPTIDLANSSLAAGSIFYSRWSKLTLHNSGTVGALIGQMIDLQNTGNLSFGVISGVGLVVWDVRQYQQIFN